MFSNAASSPMIIFHRNARFLRSFVREHDAARDVADGINIRIARLLLRVDLDEAFFVLRDFRVFQTEIGAFGTRPTETSTRS